MSVLLFAENQVLLAQGESWNVKATTDYIIKTYKAENIVKNTNENSSKSKWLFVRLQMI